MSDLCKTIMSLACLIIVAGCDPTSSPTPAKARVAQDPIAVDVDRMEAGVRIAAANKRIDELERQVGALQATPEKLDLELLTRRVEALEVKSHGDAATAGMPSEKSMSDPDQTPRPLSRPSETRQNKQQKTSKLSAPELETKSRLATTDEAEASARAK